ncbi:MAG: EamA family transporter [Candidatus Nealsonbacteria bacterium]|nr:EamA family transporter [Candidatus Nealsonbacteria bacterium]
MLWYLYSISASLLFTGMVLCTRYLGNKGFSAKQILLFLLGFAFLELLIINTGTLSNIWQSEQFPWFLVIITIAGIFAVIGNWADFTAVIKAPNPGFVGAIKTSNVLLITFAAVLIFGSSFSFIKLLGVLLIIAGLIALIVEKKNTSVQQAKKSFLKRWEVLAVIGALSFTVMVLEVKKASQMGFSSSQINLFLFAFNFLAFVLLCRKEIKNYFRDKLKLKVFLPIVFLAATFSVMANIFNVKGIAMAPNPGYHESIKNTQFLLTTLLSVPLLGAGLTKKKLLGVVMVLGGVIILVI